jgi:hypothetical protein
MQVLTEKMSSKCMFTFSRRFEGCNDSGCVEGGSDTTYGVLETCAEAEATDVGVCDGDGRRGHHQPCCAYV